MTTSILLLWGTGCGMAYKAKPSPLRAFSSYENAVEAGGAKGYASDDARREIVDDLNKKSLGNRAVKPRSLAFGFIVFPGEAPSAKKLRVQLWEADTGKGYRIQFPLQHSKCGMRNRTTEEASSFGAMLGNDGY